MIYPPDFYYIPTAIDKEVAEMIIRKCSDYQLEDSRVFDNDQNENIDYRYRISKHCWLATDNWIGGIMKHCIESANQSLFNFDLTKWTDKIQYTVYDEEGSHYKWHYDIAKSSIDKETVRKLSISLLLSSPDDYEGGELQLLLPGETVMKTFKPRLGDAIIFSSMTRHRVRPIKSGKRISLVGWYGGPAFR